MFDNTKVTQNFLFWKRKRSFFFRVYLRAIYSGDKFSSQELPPHLPVEQNIKYRVSFEETFSCSCEWIFLNLISAQMHMLVKWNEENNPEKFYWAPVIIAFEDAYTKNDIVSDFLV